MNEVTIDRGPLRGDGVALELKVSVEIFTLLRHDVSMVYADNEYSYLEAALHDLYWERVYPELTHDEKNAYDANWTYEVEGMRVGESDWTYRLDVLYYMEDEEQVSWDA